MNKPGPGGERTWPSVPVERLLDAVTAQMDVKLSKIASIKIGFKSFPSILCLFVNIASFCGF